MTAEINDVKAPTFFGLRSRVKGWRCYEHVGRWPVMSWEQLYLVACRIAEKRKAGGK